MSKATGTTKQGKKSILSIILALLLATSMTPVTQISQAFAADAPASAPAQLTLTDGSATAAIYDKNPATTTHADITLQLQLNGHTLATPIGTLLIDGNALTDGQDYTTTTAPTATTTAITYTIKSATLAAQTTGSHTLAIDIADGIPATLPIQIIDTTPLSFPRDGAAVGEERSDERNAGNPAQTPTPTQTIKANYTDTTTNNQYILNYELLSDGTLKVTGFAEKTNFNGNLTIPEQLNYNGQTYQVTALAATAFNADPDIVTFFAPSVTDIDNPVIASEAKQSSPQPTTVDTTIPSALSNNPNLLYAALPNAKNLPANLFANNPQLSYIFVPSAQTIAPTAFANLNTKQIDLTLNLALKAQTSGNTYQNQSYRFLSFGNANSTLIYPEDFLTIIANANSNNGENTQNAENTEPANSENSNGNTNSNESDNEGQTPSVTEGINDNEDQSPVATITTNPTDQIKDALTIKALPALQLLAAEEDPIKTLETNDSYTIDPAGKISVTINELTAGQLPTRVDTLLATINQSYPGKTYADIISIKVSGQITCEDSFAVDGRLITQQMTKLKILDLGDTASAYTKFALNLTNSTDIQTLILPKLGNPYSVNALYASNKRYLTYADVSNITNVPSTNFLEANPALKTLILPTKHDFVFDGGGGVFANTAIESINLLKCTSNIPPTTFQNCTALKTITMPDKPGYSVGQSAFAGCSSLESIDLSGAASLLAPFYSATSDGAGNNTSNLRTVIWPNIPFTLSDYQSNGSFRNCSLLETIDLTYMQSGAFSALQSFGGCTNLKTIYMPIKQASYSLGNLTFADSLQLSDVSFKEKVLDQDGNWVSTIDNVSLRNATSVGADVFATNPNITFVDVSNATSLATNNAALLRIGSFEGLSNLTTVKMPTTAFTLGNNTFKDCPKLTTIDVSKATAIGNNTFYGCSALTAVDISAASNIYDTPFYNSGIQTVLLPSLPPYQVDGYDNYQSSGSFAGLFGQNKQTLFLVTDRTAYDALPADGAIAQFINPVLQVPTITGISKTYDYDANGYQAQIAKQGSANLAATPTLGTGSYQWYKDGLAINGKTSDSLNISNAQPQDAATYSFSIHGLQLPSTALALKVVDTFTNDANGISLHITGVTPNTLQTKINAELSANGFSDPAAVYANIRSLQVEGSISAEDVLTSDARFIQQLLNLESLDLSATSLSTAWADATFVGNKKIKTVVLPKQGGAYTAPDFSGASALSSVDVQGAKVIGSFAGASSLTQVKLPSNAYTLAVNAFKDCTALTSLDLSNARDDNGTPAIGAHALDGATALSTLVLPSQAYSIGDAAFANLANLSALDLSKASAIGNSAFTNSNIKAVVLPMTPPAVLAGTTDWASDGTFAGVLDSIVWLSGNKTAYSALDSSDPLKTLLEPKIQVPGISSSATPTVGGSMTLTAIPALPNGVYQWYKDGAPLDGQTSASFSIATLASTDAATYRYQVFGLDFASASVKVKLDRPVVIKPGFAKDANGNLTITVADVDRAGDPVVTLQNKVDEVLTANNFGGYDSLALAYPHIVDLTVSSGNINAADTAWIKSVLTTITVLDLGAASMSGVFTAFGSATTANANRSLKEVVLPKQGTYTAAASLFQRTNIEYVDVSGLTALPNNTFTYTESLIDLILPSSFTLGTGVFQSTVLTSVDLRGCISNPIPSNTFSNAASLQEVLLPNTAFSLSTGVFNNCSSLTALDLSNATGTIAITGVTNLEQVAIPKTAGYTLGISGSTKLTSINLNNAAAVGSFQNCTALSSVTMPQQNFTLAANAFIGCSSLASIDLTNAKNSGTTAAIGSAAFQNCTALQQVLWPSSGFSISSSAFSGCTKLTSIDLTNAVDLSATVPAIGVSAFANCSYLNTVYMPTASYMVGATAFNNCLSLTDQSFKEKVITDGTWTGILDKVSFRNAKSTGTTVSIGANALQGCTNITTLDISEATVIANDAFNGLRITSVKMPEQAYTVGTTAFAYCSKLTALDLSNATTIGNQAFLGSGIKAVKLPSTKIPTLTNGNDNWVATGSFAGLFGLNKQPLFFADDISLYTAQGNTYVGNLIKPRIKVAETSSTTDAAVDTDTNLLTTHVTAKTKLTLSAADTLLDSPEMYQWYKDGVAIAGATSKDYIIQKTPATAAGEYTYTVYGLNLPTTKIQVLVDAATVSDAEVVKYNIYTDRGVNHGAAANTQLMFFEVTYDQAIVLTDPATLLSEITARQGFGDGYSLTEADKNGGNPAVSLLADGCTLRFVFYFNEGQDGHFSSKAVSGTKLLSSVLDADGLSVLYPDVDLTVSPGFYTRIVSQTAGTSTTSAQTVFEVVAPPSRTVGMVLSMMLRNGVVLNQKEQVGIYNQLNNLTVIHNYTPDLNDGTSIASDWCSIFAANGYFGKPDTALGEHQGYTATTSGEFLTVTSKVNTPDEVIDIFVISYPRDRDTGADKTQLNAAIAAAEAVDLSKVSTELSAALANELAIARARTKTPCYYLQEEVDATAAKLSTLVAEIADSLNKSDAQALSYRAYTGHGASAANDTFAYLEVTFDRDIELAATPDLFAELTAVLGGTDLTADVRNSATVLADKRTLQIALHHTAAFTGRLNISVTAADKSLPSVLDAATGGRIVLPDISLIVSNIIKDGSEFAPVEQTVATATTAASVTKAFTYPEQGTRGQIHLVLLKNGVQVAENAGAIGSEGFVPTATAHNYTPDGQTTEALLNANDGIWGGLNTALWQDYDVAVVSGTNQIKVTANNSAVGDVLDLLIVGYPRDISTKVGGVAVPIVQDKTALAAAITAAEAANASDFEDVKWQVLTAELAKARAIDASLWYLQDEIDAQEAALLAALADPGTPPPPVDPKVVAYKAYTNHQGGVGASLQGPNDDDQYLVFEVTYNKDITLADSHSVFSQFTGWFGTTDKDSINTNYDGRPANAAVVLADGKTLQLTMHIKFRAEDGHLSMTANNTDKALPAVTSAVGGVAMPFPDVDMFVSTGTVLTTLSQTLGTATTPASAVFKIETPADMTRGMAHFILLANGQPALPLITNDVDGFVYPANVQAHFFAYLTATSSDFATFVAGDIRNRGYIVSTAGNVITVTAPTAVDGQVLDMVHTGYPRDRDTLADKTALQAAIAAGNAAIGAAGFADGTTGYDAIQRAVLVKELAKAVAVDSSIWYLQSEVDDQETKLLGALDKTYTGDDFDPGTVVPDKFDPAKINVDPAGKKVTLAESLLKAFVQSNASSVVVDAGKQASLDVFPSPSSIMIGKESAATAGYVLDSALHVDGALLDPYGYSIELGRDMYTVNPAIRVVAVDGVPVGLDTNKATATIVDGKLVVTGVAAGTTKVAIEAYVQHPAPGKVEGDLIELSDGSKVPWSAWMGSRVSVPVEIAITVEGGSAAGDPRGQFELGSDVTGKGIVLSAGGLTDLAAKVSLDGVQLVNGRDYTIAAGANGLGTRITLLPDFLTSLPANASTTHALKVTFSDGFILSTSFFDRVTTVTDPNAGANTGQAAPTVVTSPVNNNYYSSGGGGGYSGGGVAATPTVANDGTSNAAGTSGPSARSNATGTDIGDNATPLSGTPNQVSVEGSGDGQLVLTIGLVVIALVLGAVAGAVAINAIRRRREAEAMLE